MKAGSSTLSGCPGFGGAVCGAYLAGRLGFGVVAVTPVTHAAESTLKVEIA